MTPLPSETSALLANGSAAAYERAIESNSYGTSIEASAADPKEGPGLETTWKIESKWLFKNSAPLIATYLLQYSFNLVLVFVSGRLGTDELGAASLASMTVNITGLCVYEGLATSLDTLTSQAYGAGRVLLVGLR